MMTRPESDDDEDAAAELAARRTASSIRSTLVDKKFPKRRSVVYVGLREKPSPGRPSEGGGSQLQAGFLDDALPFSSTGAEGGAAVGAAGAETAIATPLAEEAGTARAPVVKRLPRNRQAHCAGSNAYMVKLMEEVKVSMGGNGKHGREW